MQKFWLAEYLLKYYSPIESMGRSSKRFRTYTVEEKWAEKKPAAALFMNVKVAFNHVSKHLNVGGVDKQSSLLNTCPLSVGDGGKN